MNIKSLLMGHRGFYGQYHQHKEQMAYAASVVYIAGAAALMYADTDSLGSDKGLKIIFAIVVAVAAFAFVIWQLRLRQIASDVVEACERILARLANNEYFTEPSDPRTYKGLNFPQFLVDEIVSVANSRKLFRGAPISGLITYAIMLATSVLALVHMVC